MAGFSLQDTESLLASEKLALAYLLSPHASATEIIALMRAYLSSVRVELQGRGVVSPLKDIEPKGKTS